MELLNQKVEHILYGTGSIINQEDDILIIEFTEDSEAKRFLYPDSFDKYLKMCKDELQANVVSDLKIKKAKIEEEKRAKEQELKEEAQRREQDRLALIKPKKKTTAKK